MSIQIWHQRIELADLRAQRNDFSQKINKIKREQETCLHVIISVITLGIFAIIKAVNLWILEMQVQYLDQRIHKYEPAEGFLGDAVIDATPQRVEIRAKAPLDKMRELNKGLIEALKDIAETSPKQDDIQICFDQITEILGKLKRGEGNGKTELPKAVQLLDQALAKAKQHFEAHEKFKAFEELCLELRNTLTSDITKSKPSHTVKIANSQLVVSDFLKSILPQDKLQPVINDIEKLIAVVRETSTSLESMLVKGEKNLDNINLIKKIIQILETGYTQVRILLESSTVDEVTANMKSVLNSFKSIKESGLDKLNCNFGESVLSIMWLVHKLGASLIEFTRDLTKHFGELIDSVTDESLLAALKNEMGQMVTESLGKIESIDVSDFLTSKLPHKQLQSFLCKVEEVKRAMELAAESFELISKDDKRVEDLLTNINRIFQSLDKGYYLIKVAFHSTTNDEFIANYKVIVKFIEDESKSLGKIDLGSFNNDSESNSDMSTEVRDTLRHIENQFDRVSKNIEGLSKAAIELRDNTKDINLDDL
jgi:hypothetical protein